MGQEYRLVLCILNEMGVIKMYKRLVILLGLFVLLTSCNKNYPWFRWGFYTIVPDRDLYDVSFSDSSHGWAVGDDGIILGYDGDEWRVSVDTLWHQGTSCSYLSCVVALDSDNVWAGGTRVLLHYDGGRWEKVIEGDFVIEDMEFYGDEYGFAGGREGESGYALEYRDGEWKEITAPPEYIWSVSVVGDGEVWVSTGKMDTCYVYRYNKGEWERSELPDGYTVFALEFTSKGEGWGFEWDGVVMHYQDGEWEFWDSLYVMFWNADFLDRGHGIATGIGHICQYKDGWRVVYFPSSMFGVDYIDPDNVWIVGIGGMLMFGIPEDIEGEWREKGIDDRRGIIEGLR